MSKDSSSSIKQSNERKLKMLKTTISNLFVKGRNENLIPKEETMTSSKFTLGGTKTSIKKSRRFLSSDFTNIPKFKHETCTIQFDSNINKRQNIKRKRNERSNTYYFDQRKSYETSSKYRTNLIRSYNVVPLLRSTQGKNADRRRERN